MSEEVAAVEDTSATSLWDHAEPEAPSPAADTPPAPVESGSSEWFFAEGVKGEGDKPEWMKDKYKTMAEQAKAYGELEKKFGEMRGAPKDGYNLDGIEGFDKDDPILSQFSETFKELNLSQEGFERVFQEFNSVQSNMIQADVEAEMKKLGPNAKSEVTQINSWIDNTFDEQTAATVRAWVATADDMRALQALRSFQPRSAIPSQSDALRVGSFETSKELKAEMSSNWNRYKDDEGYRKSMMSRMTDAVKREKHGKK